jgi:Fur family ferric uptake transcriptional regulator
MRLTERKVLAELRNNGYKITPQRRAVVKAITSSRGSLSPAALYEKLRQTSPGIGLVTIYRTLEILAELSLVCELHSSGGNRSYTTGTVQHHHHLICSGCGTVFDFSGYHLEKLEKSLSRDSGFRIDGHLLEFFGLCRACQKTA